MARIKLCISVPDTLREQLESIDDGRGLSATIVKELERLWTIDDLLDHAERVQALAAALATAKETPCDS